MQLNFEKQLKNNDVIVWVYYTIALLRAPLHMRVDLALPLISIEIWFSTVKKLYNQVIQ
jgi:hypothetical protein